MGTGTTDNPCSEANRTFVTADSICLEFVQKSNSANSFLMPVLVFCFGWTD
jgi:hypothetical protein